MDDLHSIIVSHGDKNQSRKDGKKDEMDTRPEGKGPPSTSQIPDLFFDEILVEYKLTRTEIIVLMYLYRKVYCRPNSLREYGMTQLLSYTEMTKALKLSLDEVYQTLKKHEDLGFISTIRSGQYFVRMYFLEVNDLYYGQTYGEF